MLDTPTGEAPEVSAAAKEEGGFILVWAALMFFVLVIMAGFAVDLGSWYLRAQQVQRAADAAALSGVTLLPGTPAAATNQALASAERNGFADSTGTTTAPPCTGNPHPSICVTALQDTDPSAGGATGNPYQLDVTVEDNSVPAYFTSFFMGKLSIKRTAKAEFSQPLPLGSPENIFGTGNIPGLSRGYWAAINGYCAAKEEGDRYASAFDGNVVVTGQTRTYTLGKPGGNPGSCSATPLNPSGSATANPEYSPTSVTSTGAPKGGYIFDVSVPLAPVGLDVFDPYYTVYNPAQSATDRSPDRSYSTDTNGLNTANVTTLYTVYDPTFHVVCQQSFGTNNTIAVYKQWFRLCKLTTTGTYRLQVSTPPSLTDTPSGPQSFGGNSYSLAVEKTPVPAADNGTLLPTGTVSAGTLCSALSDATCPQIYGEDAISVLVDSQSPQTDTQNPGYVKAEFYLAQIQAAQAGKNLTIELWDPGDVSAAQIAAGLKPMIQILDNSNPPKPIPFTYLVAPADATKGIPPSNTLQGCDSSGANPSTANTNPCNAQMLNGTALDTSGQVAQKSNRYGTGIFNDGLVQLFITVPGNYCQSTCTNGGWWKIKYLFPGAQGSVPPLADRATWRVLVNGDPVHLLP